MADNKFRTHGSRDGASREEFDSGVHDTANDPLAELARLIGQGDPYDAGRRLERHSAPQSEGDAGPGFEWASSESYAEQYDHGQDHYAPSPSDGSHPDLASQHAPYEEEPPPARFFSGPAARFSGFREESAASQADYAANADELQTLPPAGQLAPGAPPAYEGYDETGDAGHGGEQAYAAGDYEEDAPQSRRGGLVVVMAVLGLVVLGTAGAFGYRAMFGGSVLSSLPPIIKASNGPTKIKPNYGDAQPSKPNQPGAPSASPAEQLAPPAEQPVDVQQSVKTAPRVVSTIPITAAPSAAAPAPQTPAGAAQVATAPPPPPPQAAPPPPPQAAPTPPPPAAPPAAATPPPPAAAAPPPAAPSAPPASPEPKKVHTVTIRADQPASRPAAPAGARKPSAAATPARGDEPLSIVPGAGGDASAPAPVRARAAAPPKAVASAAPTGTPATATPSAGGYAVQVTSQRTEAEAHAAFRSLKAKYPNQLGGREPIVRRADLGAKGTYYRALVGPFASAEAAAEMCSSLKAAGGTCIVQRN